MLIYCLDTPIAPFCGFLNKLNLTKVPCFVRYVPNAKAIINQATNEPQIAVYSIVEDTEHVWDKGLIEIAGKVKRKRNQFINLASQYKLHAILAGDDFRKEETVSELWLRYKQEARKK